MCPDMANIFLAYKTMKQKKTKNWSLKHNCKNKPLFLSITNTVNLISNKQISLLSAVPLVRLILWCIVLHITTAILFWFNLQPTKHITWQSAYLSHHCHTRYSLKLKCLHILVWSLSNMTNFQNMTIENIFPMKWSHVNHRSGIDHGKSAS